MDCERLILLVQERNYLWDQRESNYHMRNVQKQLWKEVAAQMKVSEEDVKKKWRGLRDTFRKEIMKQMKHKPGSGAETQACQPPSWPFFTQLSFLADTIKPRRMESNVPSVESDETSLVSDECSADNALCEESAAPSISQITQASLATCWSHYEDVDSQLAPQSSSNKKLIKSPAKKKRCSKTEVSNFDEKLLELETKKVKYLQQKATRVQDGDLQFLLSVLPYLHDIPKDRKLIVRQNIMGVLIEELQQHHSATFTHSTTNYSSDESSQVP